MKICYLIAYPGYGGSENYSLYLAEEAIKKGNQVYFVVGEEGPLNPIIKEKRIPLKIIPMKSTNNPFLLMKSAISLRRYIKEYKIELVHINQLREQLVAILCKLFGAKIKIVRTFHRIGQFNRKLRLLSFFFNSLTDSFIAVSREMHESMRSNGFSKKTVIILNGVREVKVNNHEKSLGFLGRIVSEKGIYNFLQENIKEISERIVIGGDGPDFEKVKELSIINTNVVLLGNILNREDFFSKISVLLLPSVTEAMPLTMLEAFSASIPVVAFELPSLKDVIKDKENGILVKPGDYKNLYRKAKELLEDEYYLKKLSDGAKKTFEKDYTVEKMWQKTEELYKSVLR